MNCHNHVIAVFVLLLPVVAVADESETTSPLSPQGHIVEFQRDVAPILAQKCLACHGPENAKNDFRVDDFDTMMQYVEPGDWQTSALYTDYLIAAGDDGLMPPLQHGGPLASSELALIRVWIEEGAHWPEDAVVGNPEASGTGIVLMRREIPSSESVEPKTLLQRVWAFQGYLHPAVVHFPIALLLFGALFVVLGWKWPTLGTQIPVACLLVGTLAAIAATLMGWALATERGYADWTTINLESEVFWHRWSGVTVAIVSTILTAVAVLSLRHRESRLTVVWKSGLLLVAIIVGLVGHKGGELTYGKDFYPKAFRVLSGASAETNSKVNLTQTNPKRE